MMMMSPPCCVMRRLSVHEIERSGDVHAPAAYDLTLEQLRTYGVESVKLFWRRVRVLSSDRECAAQLRIRIQNKFRARQNELGRMSRCSPRDLVCRWRESVSDL